MALAAAALVACSAVPAVAQSVPASGKVTGGAEAQVVLVTPLSFNKVDDLMFGKVAAGSSGGTVVLSPFGGITTTGSALAAGASAQPAAFAGYGARNQLVTIRISSTAINLVRAGGSETMRVDTFVIGSTPTAVLTTAPVQFRISTTSGAFQFPVGATLRVAANQTPGNYTGSFAITLNYL